MADFAKKVKLTELENKIPDIIPDNLATKNALTAAENEIPSVSNLVNKINYNTKITVIEKKLSDHNHDKFISTPEFNTLAADVFNSGSYTQANLITKTDFDSKLSSFNMKLLKIKQSTCLLKMNWMIQKLLIQVALLARIILEKMV